jgi:predicted nucleic acid-binding protein
MKLFADTSALLALILADDQNHAAAAAHVAAHPSHRYVLTDLVLAEMATRLRARAGAARAVEVTRSLLSGRRYELIFVDREILDGALDRMARFSDRRLSLCDCASFDTIERLGLWGAFTFDRDFRDCGFSTVP